MIITLDKYGRLSSYLKTTKIKYPTSQNRTHQQTNTGGWILNISTCKNSV